MNIDTERLCKELRDIQEAHLHYFPGVQWTPLQHKALDTAIALIGTLSETVASVEALVKDFGGADSGNAASGSANPTGAEEDKRAPTARPKPPAAPHPDNWVREVGKVSETERHAVRAGWMEG